MKTKFCEGIFLICLAVACVPLFSQTQVSGTIINATWSKSGSPYIVNSDLLIASLKIEPGVLVLFNGKFVFEVAGKLEAVGTDKEMIVFRSDTSRTFWRGIFFNGSQPSELSHCLVEWSIQGGIRVNSSSPFIHHCRIKNNFAFVDGMPANTGAGSGIDVRSGHPVISNCVIDSNYVTLYSDYASFYNKGGALCVSGSAQASLYNCVISYNLLESFPGHSEGGGIYIAQGSVDIANCVIYGNETRAQGDAEGGGIHLAAYEGSTSAKATILNSIVYANKPSQISWFSWIDPPKVTYSCIDGGYSGDENINYNPLFLDNQFHLIDGASPCIDKGTALITTNDLADPNNPLIALFPSLGLLRNDIGAYGGPKASNLPFVNIPTRVHSSRSDHVPALFSLQQNYPNPFNSSTCIQFEISAEPDISLTIFNMKGEKINTLFKGSLPVGVHRVSWNGTSELGIRVPSGIYFYRLQSPNQIQNRKCILVQ